MMERSLFEFLWNYFWVFFGLWVIYLSILNIHKEKKEKKQKIIDLKRNTRNEIKEKKQFITNLIKILNGLEKNQDKKYKKVEIADGLYMIKRYKEMIKKEEDELVELKRKLKDISKS